MTSVFLCWKYPEGFASRSPRHLTAPPRVSTTRMTKQQKIKINQQQKIKNNNNNHQKITKNNHQQQKTKNNHQQQKTKNHHQKTKNHHQKTKNSQQGREEELLEIDENSGQLRAVFQLDREKVEAVKMQVRSCGVATMVTSGVLLTE